VAQESSSRNKDGERIAWRATDSPSVPSFPEERSDKNLWARPNRAADVIVNECRGLMF
jgi:hypothetical protein